MPRSTVTSIIPKGHRESKSENLSPESSLNYPIKAKYVHNLTDFDIALDEYNNNNNYCCTRVNNIIAADTTSTKKPNDLRPNLKIMCESPTPQIAETSVSFHEPHQNEFMIIAESSRGKNKSFEHMNNCDLSDDRCCVYYKKDETQKCCSNNENNPCEIKEEDQNVEEVKNNMEIESGTATFRESERSVNRTEILKDEIDELNSEIVSLQNKINSAIKKKKQDNS